MEICDICGVPLHRSLSTLDNPYHYTESGLPNIRLVNVSVYACPKCHGEVADIPNLRGLHCVIAQDIILTPYPMTGPEFRFLRKETNMKLREFAECMGVDPKTITNWENSEHLSKQNDVAVRFLVAAELGQGKELAETIRELSEISRHSWAVMEEAETTDTVTQDVARLAESNTVLGLGSDQTWKIAA